jgi:hypothetical protein
MALHVREARPDDLDDIAALTRRHRHQLAAWEPTYWRMAEGADELHPLWLAHLLTSADAVARVVVDADTDAVGACAICVRQPGQWFADDVATAADERWSDAGTLLFRSLEERPLLTCVPTKDRPRVAAAGGAGWEHVADYRTLRLEAPTGPRLARTTTATPPPPPAPHTFAGAVDPSAPGAIVVSDGRGIAVASAPLPAPPVYDPGGTSCVVDRVVGPEPRDLLDEVAAAAAEAGAGQLIVVCGTADDGLRRALDDRRAGHPVEVHRAP